MAASADALLLSVRWEYASLIFEGLKTVELRRTRPRAGPGTPALVYVPAPHKRLVGGFVVGGIVQGSPAYLWREVGCQTGVTRTECLRYFAGVAIGYGIAITDPWMLDAPISLSAMRRHLPGFHPPQVFRYLTPAQQKSLVA